MDILWLFILFIINGFYRDSTKLAKTNDSLTIYMKKKQTEEKLALINIF